MADSLHVNTREEGQRRPMYLTREEAVEAAASAATRLGPCPACNGKHSFTRTFGSFAVPWPSHRLEGCAEFEKLSPGERAHMLEAQGGCCLCTASSHKHERCWQRQFGKSPRLCTVQEGAHPCGRPHHPLLHGSSSTYCSALTTTSSTMDHASSQALSAPSSGSLFELQEVPISSPCGGCTTSALMMVDSGSTDTFITHDLAAHLRLPSTPTTLAIRVLDQGYREQSTSTYSLDLVDLAGCRHRVEAIGMASLTEVAAAPQVSALAQLFPEAPPGAAAAFQRPHGKVSLMLGQRDMHLHAREALEHQGLRLRKSIFSPGWVLTGWSALGASTTSSSTTSSSNSSSTISSTTAPPLAGPSATSARPARPAAASPRPGLHLASAQSLHVSTRMVEVCRPALHPSTTCNEYRGWPQYGGNFTTCPTPVTHPSPPVATPHPPVTLTWSPVSASPGQAAAVFVSSSARASTSSSARTSTSSARASTSSSAQASTSSARTSSPEKMLGSRVD